MKTIHRWQYQHNRDKVWTVDFDYLQRQLQTTNHTRLQARDENGKRVTNGPRYQRDDGRWVTPITFTVNWNLSNLDYTLKNVPQVLVGELTDLEPGIDYVGLPTLEVWFMEYIPKVGDEPWLVAPMELPAKPHTVIYQEKFLSAQEWIITGEAGFRVIHLPHINPIWFKQSSIVHEGVEVIVDSNQRVIQINTNLFEGKKELCRLKISGTARWETPKFSYIYPYNSIGRGFTVDVYELKENDVPILFANKGKVQTYPLAVWEQAKIDYKANHYDWLEKTQIQPPLQVINDVDLPDNCLTGIAPRLVKMPLGTLWDDTTYPNPDPDSPWPILTKPGVKRSFEGLAARVLINMKDGEQVENLMAASAGNYNPDVPGIYQPEVSLSIPDVPNPLNLFHKVWVVVLNEDGSEPEGVMEFWKVNHFEELHLTVPQHYPEELLKGHFFGLNYPHFAGLARKGYFVTDYARLSLDIDWENAEFPTAEVGTFEVEGIWTSRYNIWMPDVVANAPKIFLHVVGDSAELPIIEEPDLPPEQPETPDLVPINTANHERLQDITGVGPAVAHNIIAARTDKPIADVNDLTRVNRIGGATAAKMNPEIDYSP